MDGALVAYTAGVVADEASDEERVDAEGSCCACAPVGDKARDPWWDNFKGGLQFFVLLIHMGLCFGFLADYEESYLSVAGRLRHGVLSVIRLITMPGYALISGYFSSTEVSSKRIIEIGRFFFAFLIQHAIAVTLALPGLTAQAAGWKRHHPDWKEEGLTPPSVLPLKWWETLGEDWYLVALIVWRVTLPLLARFTRPLLASVFFAVFMMMTDSSNTVYSMAPLGFLPFFILGYKLKARRNDLAQLRSSNKVRAAFVFSATVMVLSLQVTQLLGTAVDLGLGCVYGGWVRDESHARLFLNDTEQEAWIAQSLNFTDTSKAPMAATHSTLCPTPAGVACTLLVYATSSLMVLGSMSLVPGRQVWLLTKAGRNSLYIFLCQSWFWVVPGFIVTAVLRETAGPMPQLFSLLPLLLVSFVAWACMAGEWIKTCCFYCVEPPYERCFIAEAAEADELENRP